MSINYQNQFFNASVIFMLSPAEFTLHTSQLFATRSLRLALSCIMHAAYAVSNYKYRIMCLQVANRPCLPIPLNVSPERPFDITEFIAKRVPSESYEMSSVSTKLEIVEGRILLSILNRPFWARRLPESIMYVLYK